MEQLDNQQLAEGPGSIPKSDVRPGDAGDLGVEMASYQPAAVAPAALHLHQVPENTPGHVGHEPASHALPKVKTDLVPAQQQEQDPSYHSREPYPHAPVESGEKSAGSGSSQKSSGNQEQAGGANEGMLGQMAHKAAELYEGVKGTVAPALENVKEKASEAWHAVAGTIGAGPGPELKEDYTERVVAGQDDLARANTQSSQQDQAKELRRLSSSSEYEKLQQQGVVLMGLRKVPLERRVSIANPYAAIQEFQSLFQDRNLPPLLESKPSTAISRVN